MAYLAAGIAVFSVQGLIQKLLGGSYPLYRAMVLRSVIAVPLLLLLVLMNGGTATLFTPALRKMLLCGLLLFLAARPER